VNEPDHHVVAALALDAGCDWVEERLGVRPQPGGQHVRMGTHNALLSLGPRLYLEVIAIDPAGSAPPRPRWFDLDEPRMRAALGLTDTLKVTYAKSPRLGAMIRTPRGIATL
jgi:hypothetical protein